MFAILKRNGAKDILQKHGLKYVLGISVILQMYHTKPLNGVGIPLDGSDCFLFAPHDCFSYLPRPPRKPFPRPPWQLRPYPPPWPVP